jgi:hypothetical protein
MVHGWTLGMLARAASTAGVGVAVAGTLAVAAPADPLAPMTAKAAAPNLLIDTGGALGLSVGADRLAPGDTLSRRLTVHNAGTRTVALALAATRVPQDATPLQLRVDRCSKAWVAPPTGAPTLTCPGTVTALGAWRPLAAAGAQVALGSLAGAKTAWVRVQLRLPQDTPATAAGTASRVAYRVTAG